jgi:hypothetical protein
MLNNSYIKKKALLRAYELKVQQRKRKKYLTIAIAMFGICLMFSTIAVAMQLYPMLSPMPSTIDENSDDYITIPDDEIPLHMFEFPYDHEDSYSFEIVLSETEETIFSYISGAHAPDSCLEDLNVRLKIEEGKNRKAKLIIRKYSDDGELLAEIVFDLALP